MLRRAFIDELLLRGVFPGDRVNEALALVDGPSFNAWIDQLDLDRETLVAARCAVWSLPPAPRQWLLAPRVAKSSTWDVALFRQLRCVPVNDGPPLAILFADPEIALGSATRERLPPHMAYLVDLRDVLRLQGVVFGTHSDDSGQSLAVSSADIDGALAGLTGPAATGVAATGVAATGVPTTGVPTTVAPLSSTTQHIANAPLLEARVSITAQSTVTTGGIMRVDGRLVHDDDEMPAPSVGSSPAATVDALAREAQAALAGAIDDEPPLELSGFSLRLPPRIGRFKLGKLLGQGGMAAVLQAHDEIEHVDVALKLLNPAVVNDVTLERFKREAVAGVRLRHDNVVAVYGAGSEGGHHWIATELVEGGTVRDLMARLGPFPPLLAVKVITQVLDGLGAAHALGVIHRDLKPANLLITSDGRVKLGDFGVAKAHNDETLTQAGVVFGTPAYMSPEQALGEKIDTRSDLFATGTLLYQLLTGANPFANDSLSASLLLVARGEVPDILERQPTLPELFGEVMGRLMARHRDDRYQTTHEVKAALRPLLDLVDHHWPDVVADALKEPIAVREALYLQQARCEQARARACMRDKPLRKMEAAWALRRSLELDRGDPRALTLLRRLCQQEGYSFGLPVDEGLRAAVLALSGGDRENPIIVRKLALGCVDHGALEHAVRLLRDCVAHAEIGDSVVEQRLAAIVGDDPVLPFRFLSAVGALDTGAGVRGDVGVGDPLQGRPGVGFDGVSTNPAPQHLAPATAPSGSAAKPASTSTLAFDELAEPQQKKLVPFDQVPDRSLPMPVANLVEARPRPVAAAAPVDEPKRAPLLAAAVVVVVVVAVAVVVAVVVGRMSAGSSADPKAKVEVRDDVRQQAQLQKAHAAYQQGDLGKALDEVGVAIAIDKGTAVAAEAFLLQGKIQQAVGNLGDARSAYDSAMVHPRAAPRIKTEASSLRFLLP